MKRSKQERKSRAAKRVRGLIADAENGKISDGQRTSILANEWYGELTEAQIVERALVNLKKQFYELTSEEYS